MVLKLNRRKLQDDASVSNGASWHRTSSRIGVTKKKLFVGVQIFLLLVQNSVAFADPGGGTVVVGSASIQQAGSTRTIQQFTDRAVINWQDFSIQQGETTRFIQPSSSSAVLNRVTGGNPSAILGTLEANGNVFLVNPNGIVVGAGARINVNGLVASTLELSDANFMLGSDFLFEGNSNASVINEGVVQALGGDIYILGSHVENHGTLQAENGTVGLGAGQSIRIVDSNFPSLVVRATAESLGGTGIVNTGFISATQAELIANGGNVYGLAINNEGIVRATGSEIRGGRVFLISDGGKIRSSGDIVAKRGQNGGDVIIHAGGQSGSKIEILGNIDVSGDEYGGTVGMKAASILLGGATVNLQGGIEDGVRLISLGSSSAEIVDPTNTGFLDFSNQNGVLDQTRVVDNANQIQVFDGNGLSVNDSIITSDLSGFVDLQIKAANPEQFISFITFDLAGGTTSSDATITFEVELQKPSGATEMVVLEAKFSDLTDNKVAIKATGGDLIKAITFNSDSGGDDGHAFICEVKTGDVELATGTLTIAKHVSDGSDEYQDFQFLITADDSTLSGGSDFVEAFLSHGENESINLLTAGEYTIQEILPEGWFLDSIDIQGDGGNSITNLEDASAIVHWNPHDNILVTYTNTEGAHIAVFKHAEGGENVDFAFQVEGIDNLNNNFEYDFTLKGESETKIGQDGYVRPGTYTIEELGAAGWFFDEVHSDGSVSYDPQQTVTVVAGDCVEFCYYNSQGGQITIAKNAIGPNGSTTDFGFTASGGDIQSTFSVAGNDSLTLSSSSKAGYLRPGTYTISELETAGWFFDNVSGGDGNPDSPVQLVTVLAGENKTLTYQNSQGVQITVVKDAIGSNASETDFNFTAVGTTIDNEFTLTGSDSITLGSIGLDDYVRPGLYTIEELATPGWSLTGVSGDGFVVVDPRSASQSLDLEAGRSLTLTFTNTQIILNPAIGFRYDPIFPVGIGLGELAYDAGTGLAAADPADPDGLATGNFDAGSTSFDTFSQ